MNRAKAYIFQEKHNISFPLQIKSVGRSVFPSIVMPTFSAVPYFSNFKTYLKYRNDLLKTKNIMLLSKNKAHPKIESILLCIVGENYGNHSHSHCGDIPVILFVEKRNNLKVPSRRGNGQERYFMIYNNTLILLDITRIQKSINTSFGGCLEIRQTFHNFLPKIGLMEKNTAT